jgi:hypothetical protein
MAKEYAADWVSELEQEFDDELPPVFHPESEFDLWAICGEARKHRSRLVTARGALRSRAIVHARKWLRTTANRWPYERLRELTRRELDIIAGCLYGVASAIGEETEPYRRLRSDIGRLLGVPGR